MHKAKRTITLNLDEHYEPQCTTREMNDALHYAMTWGLNLNELGEEHSVTIYNVGGSELVAIYRTVEHIRQKPSIMKVFFEMHGILSPRSVALNSGETRVEHVYSWHS